MHGKAKKIIEECEQTGEPIFVLRSKDLLSVLAVIEYRDLLDKYWADPAMMEGVGSALDQMREWQKNNPGLVRLPD